MVLSVVTPMFFWIKSIVVFIFFYIIFWLVALFLASLVRQLCVIITVLVPPFLLLLFSLCGSIRVPVGASEGEYNVII